MIWARSFVRSFFHIFGLHHLCCSLCQFLKKGLVHLLNPLGPRLHLDRLIVYLRFFFASCILNNQAQWVHFRLTTGDLSLFLYILGVATYRIPTIQVARDLRRRSCIDGVHMDCVMVRLLKKLLQSLQQFLNINIPWILVHLVTRTTIRILDKLRGL